MKTLLAITVLIMCLFSLSARTQPSIEYKVEAGIDAKKLNSLAVEGWEVVATGNYGGQLAAPYVILKRTK